MGTRSWCSLAALLLLSGCLYVAAAKADEVSVLRTGMDDHAKVRPLMILAAEEQCEPNYGFLPCSTSVAGNVFLLIVYGFLLLKAAQFLSEGSEMLLLVLNPGLIGGLLLPILGALPDAILILVSGLFASEEEVLSQVLVGMGLLAGSTIMLLTLLWGSSMIVGRCDLKETNDGSLVAEDRKLTRKFDVHKTGVTTDAQTKASAWIMLITVIPYILAQLPKMISKPKYDRFFVLLSCAFAFAGLIAYCVYQVVSPWIQQRRIALARQKFRVLHTLQRLSQYSKSKSWGDLLLPDGKPNEEALTKLFSYFDEDQSGHLAHHELKALIIGLGIGHEEILPKEEEVENWMKDFDRSNDERISKDEFISGFTRWLKDLQTQGKEQQQKNGHDREQWDTEAQNAETSYVALMGGPQDKDEEDEEESSEKSLTKNQIVTRAVLLILLGALIAGVFADPLVDSIENFSSATGIPSFFIAFVATPLATNSSEAISSILFAAKKKKQNISLTYSQIYGGVTMNNTLCLGIFLAVVAYRGLTWDFSSEVLVITIVALIMGILGGSRTTFPLWTSFIALALYPLSILMVAFLDYVLGWQ